jgi:DNA-binding response OmpR family regulator
MKRLLVIDDEQELLEEISEWLQYEGYQVFTAASGQEGIHIALNTLPDLILCDIMMDDMDGYRVLLELRTHAETALTPFIFLTALSKRQDVRYGMELGADDYLTKPFTQSELLKAIRARLEKHHRHKTSAEQALGQLRAVLTMSLPHELRTPLSVMMGYGELLSLDAESYTPEEVMAMGESISHNARRLFRLVENHLLYSELEALRLDPAHFRSLPLIPIKDSGPVIKEEAQRIAFDHKRFEDLALDLEPSPVGMGQEHFRKILRELLDNAFKFSAPGQRVQVRSRAQADGRLQLFITDGGRGFAPGELSQVTAFRQFNRQRYEQQGLGLGLVIAKYLVELHGGDLQIQSQAGSATQVSLLLAGQRA